MCLATAFGNEIVLFMSWGIKALIPPNGAGVEAQSAAGKCSVLPEDAGPHSPGFAGLCARQGGDGASCHLPMVNQFCWHYVSVTYN